MKFIRYTGPYRSVNCLNIEFPRNEYVPVPPRVADKLLKNREFEAKPADNADQLIRITPAAPAAPAKPAAYAPVDADPVRIRNRNRNR